MKMLTSKRKYKSWSDTGSVLSSQSKSDLAEKSSDTQTSMASTKKTLGSLKLKKTDSAGQMYKKRHNIGRRQAAERVGCYKDSETAVSFQGYESWPSFGNARRKQSIERPLVDNIPAEKSSNIISTLKTESALNSAVNDLLLSKTKKVCVDTSSRGFEKFPDLSSVDSNRSMQLSSDQSNIIKSPAVSKQLLKPVVRKKIIKPKNFSKTCDLTVAKNISTKIAPPTKVIVSATNTTMKAKMTASIKQKSNALSASNRNVATPEKRKISVKSKTNLKSRCKMVAPVLPNEVRTKRESCLNAEAFMSLMYNNERPAKSLKSPSSSDVKHDESKIVSNTTNQSLNLSSRERAKTTTAGELKSKGEMEFKPDLKRRANLAAPLTIKKEVGMKSDLVRLPNLAATFKNKVAEKIKKKSVKKALVADQRKKKPEPVFAALPRRMASLNAQAILFASHESWNQTPKERKSTDSQKLITSPKFSECLPRSITTSDKSKQAASWDRDNDRISSSRSNSTVNMPAKSSETNAKRAKASQPSKSKKDVALHSGNSFQKQVLTTTEVKSPSTIDCRKSNEVFQLMPLNDQSSSALERKGISKSASSRRRSRSGTVSELKLQTAVPLKTSQLKPSTSSSQKSDESFEFSEDLPSIPAFKRRKLMSGSGVNKLAMHNYGNIPITSTVSASVSSLISLPSMSGQERNTSCKTDNIVVASGLTQSQIPSASMKKIKPKQTNLSQTSNESISSGSASTVNLAGPLIPSSEVKTSPSSQRAKNGISCRSDLPDLALLNRDQVSLKPTSSSRKTKKRINQSIQDDSKAPAVPDIPGSVNSNLNDVTELSSILPPGEETNKLKGAGLRKIEKESPASNSSSSQKKIVPVSKFSQLPDSTKKVDSCAAIISIEGGRSRSRQTNWNLKSNESILIKTTALSGSESVSTTAKEDDSKSNKKAKKGISTSKAEHFLAAMGKSSVTLPQSLSLGNLPSAPSCSVSRTCAVVVSNKATTLTKGSSVVISTVPLSVVEFAMSPQDSRVQFAGSMPMSSPTPNKQLAEMTTVTKSSTSRGCQLAPIRLYQSGPSSSGSTTQQTQRNTMVQTALSGGQLPVTAVTPSRDGNSNNKQQQQQRQLLPATNNLTLNCVPGPAPQAASSTFTLPVRFTANAIGQNTFNVYSVQPSHLQGFYTSVPVHPAYVSPPGNNGVGHQRVGNYGYVEQANPYAKNMGQVSVGFGSSQDGSYGGGPMILPRAQSINFGMMYKAGPLSNMNNTALYMPEQLSEVQHYQSQLPKTVLLNGDNASHVIASQAHKPYAKSIVISAQSVAPFPQFVCSPTSTASVDTNGTTFERAGVTGGSVAVQFTPRELADCSYSCPTMSQNQACMPKSMQAQSLKSGQLKDCAVQALNDVAWQIGRSNGSSQTVLRPRMKNTADANHHNNYQLPFDTTRPELSTIAACKTPQIANVSGPAPAPVFVSVQNQAIVAPPPPQCPAYPVTVVPRTTAFIQSDLRSIASSNSGLVSTPIPTSIIAVSNVNSQPLVSNSTFPSSTTTSRLARVKSPKSSQVKYLANPLSPSVTVPLTCVNTSTTSVSTMGGGQYQSNHHTGPRVFVSLANEPQVVPVVSSCSSRVRKPRAKDSSTVLKNGCSINLVTLNKSHEGLSSVTFVPGQLFVETYQDKELDLSRKCPVASQSSEGSSTRVINKTMSLKSSFGMPLQNKSSLQLPDVLMSTQSAAAFSGLSRMPVQDSPPMQALDFRQQINQVSPSHVSQAHTSSQSGVLPPVQSGVLSSVQSGVLPPPPSRVSCDGSSSTQHNSPYPASHSLNPTAQRGKRRKNKCNSPTQSALQSVLRKSPGKSTISCKKISASDDDGSGRFSNSTLISVSSGNNVMDARETEMQLSTVSSIRSQNLSPDFNDRTTLESKDTTLSSWKSIGHRDLSSIPVEQTTLKLNVTEDQRIRQPVDGQSSILVIAEQFPEQYQSIVARGKSSSIVQSDKNLVDAIAGQTELVSSPTASLDIFVRTSSTSDNDVSPFTTPEKNLSCSPAIKNRSACSSALVDKKPLKRKYKSVSPVSSTQVKKKLKSSSEISPIIRSEGGARASSRVCSALYGGESVRREGVLRSDHTGLTKEKKEDKSCRKSREEASKRLTPPGKKRDSSNRAKWLWYGEPRVKPIFTQMDGPAVKIMSYSAICYSDGDVINVRDCVLVKSGMRKKDIPYVAKIYGFWNHAETGEMMMGVYWYYRLEHTETKQLSKYIDREVFASRHRDIIPVACIEDRCYVLTLNEFNRYKADVKRSESYVLRNSPVPVSNEAVPSRLPLINVDQETVFLCRHIYDIKLKRILKNPQIHIGVGEGRHIGD